MCHFRRSALVAVVSASLLVVSSASGDDGLVAHWKLAGDCKDHSGGNHHAINHGVRFGTSEGAIFNGTDAWLEVPASAWWRKRYKPGLPNASRPGPT